MSSRPSLGVHEEKTRLTAGRSSLYSMLARALAVPDLDFHTSLSEGEFIRALEEAVACLPYPLPELDLVDFELPDFIQFQADYIAFFDVGVKGPVCPLYEGAFLKDRGRKAIMEDLLRFYHHFDIKMSDRVRELPDQLSAELEFMHYLTYLEAGIEANPDQANEDAQENPRLDLIRAQRDFICRHLAVWVPDLAQRTMEREGPAFYRSLLKFLQGYIVADRDYLEDLLSR